MDALELEAVLRSDLPELRFACKRLKKRQWECLSTYAAFLTLRLRHIDNQSTEIATRRDSLSEGDEVHTQIV